MFKNIKLWPKPQENKFYKIPIHFLRSDGFLNNFLFVSNLTTNFGLKVKGYIFFHITTCVKRYIVKKITKKPFPCMHLREKMNVGAVCDVKIWHDCVFKMNVCFLLWKRCACIHYQISTSDHILFQTKIFRCIQSNTIKKPQIEN